MTARLAFVRISLPRPPPIVEWSDSSITLPPANSASALPGERYNRSVSGSSIAAGTIELPPDSVFSVPASVSIEPSDPAAESAEVDSEAPAEARRASQAADGEGQ